MHLVPTDIRQLRHGLPEDRRVTARSDQLPIPTKSSTHSVRSRPAVPGQAVRRFRDKSSGLSGDP
jgi:hypothetical protein